MEGRKGTYIYRFQHGLCGGEDGDCHQYGGGAGP